MMHCPQSFSSVIIAGEGSGGSYLHARPHKSNRTNDDILVSMYLMGRSNIVGFFGFGTRHWKEL